MKREILDTGIISDIRVTLDDGSIWLAEYDGTDLMLKVQIEPPTKPSSSPSESEGESSEAPKPEEASEGEDEAEGDPEDIFAGIEKELPKGAEKLLEELAKAGAFKKSENKEKPRSDQPDRVNPLPENVKNKMKDNAFKARLSSVMLDNKYDRRLKGRTRGKLDMTRLFKVPTQSRSIFTQKQSRKGKQYNIVLVVDESGSMMYDKARIAAECAVFIAKNFEGLNLNVGIIGFNSFITIRKELTGKCDYDRVYEAISTVNWDQGAGHNNDYDALNRAYHMFKKAPKGKNILIMLSDGQPASYKNPRFVDINGELEDPKKYPPHHKFLDYSEKDMKIHLHALVKAYSHEVTSIGIGIEHGGWQIPDHFIVQDLTELKPALINTLKKHIKRG